MSDNNQTYKADNGKARLDLVSPTFIEAVGKIRTFGVQKYGDSDSWTKVEPQRYMAALLRHINAYRMGEEIDKESGMSHLWHAACNLMFLIDLDELKAVSFGKSDNPLKRMAEALQGVTSRDFGELKDDCEGDTPPKETERICANCRYFANPDWCMAHIRETSPDNCCKVYAGKEMCC